MPPTTPKPAETKHTPTMAEHYAHSNAVARQACGCDSCTFYGAGEIKRMVESHAALLAAAEAVERWQSVPPYAANRGLPPDLADQLRAAIRAAREGEK